MTDIGFMRCLFKSEGLRMTLPLVSHENTPTSLVSAHVNHKFDANVTGKGYNTCTTLFKKSVSCVNFLTLRARYA